MSRHRTLTFGCRLTTSHRCDRSAFHFLLSFFFFHEFVFPARASQAAATNSSRATLLIFHWHGPPRSLSGRICSPGLPLADAKRTRFSILVMGKADSLSFFMVVIILFFHLFVFAGPRGDTMAAPLLSSALLLLLRARGSRNSSRQTLPGGCSYAGASVYCGRKLI